MGDAGPERQLNIQIDPDHLVGVYANFANISFSEYEFTLTFARIDHEAEQGDVPGVVVTRVNMSPKFAKASAVSRPFDPRLAGSLKRAMA